MADREKVINGLRILWTWCVVNPDYGNGLSIDECKYAAEWAEGALALLNAQEPVLPGQGHSGGGGTWWYVCGVCGTAINPGDKYCHECGRAVKWK